jgi:hypothetical protein
MCEGLVVTPASQHGGSGASANRGVVNSSRDAATRALGGRMQRRPAAAVPCAVPDVIPSHRTSAWCGIEACTHLAEAVQALEEAVGGLGHLLARSPPHALCNDAPRAPVHEKRACAGCKDAFMCTFSAPRGGVFDSLARPGQLADFLSTMCVTLMRVIATSKVPPHPTQASGLPALPPFTHTPS